MNADKFITRAVILLGILSLAIPDARAADAQDVQSLAIAIGTTAVGGYIVIRILARAAYEWLTSRRIDQTVRKFAKPTSRTVGVARGAR